MDSPKKAVYYLFIRLPLFPVFKLAEWAGIVYGLLAFPFDNGKYKASKIYDNINNP